MLDKKEISDILQFVKTYDSRKPVEPEQLYGIDLIPWEGHGYLAKDITTETLNKQTGKLEYSHVLMQHPRQISPNVTYNGQKLFYEAKQPPIRYVV